MRASLKPETLGSLTPSQSADLRGLLAEVQPGELVRAIGAALYREGIRRHNNRDTAGAAEFLRASDRLFDVAPDMPAT